jgi:hypothetical protein
MITKYQKFYEKNNEMEMNEQKQQINWSPEPEEHDYPAAASYLSLLYSASEVEKIVEDLKNAKMTSFKAKDIFRASQLKLLDDKNFHVKKNLKKIEEGKSLSPLLLYRDETHGRVVIADGFHRLCSAYCIFEDLDIPCKIV